MKHIGQASSDGSPLPGKWLKNNEKPQDRRAKRNFRRSKKHLCRLPTRHASLINTKRIDIRAMCVYGCVYRTRDHKAAAILAMGMAQVVNQPENEAQTRSFWSARQFIAWQKAVGLSGQKAAKALGVSDNSISNYRRRGCPRTVALACIALYGRQDETLKPWEKAA